MKIKNISIFAQFWTSAKLWSVNLYILLKVGILCIGKLIANQSHEWQQVKTLKSFFLDFLFLGVTLDLIIGEKNTKKMS